MTKKFFIFIYVIGLWFSMKTNLYAEGIDRINAKQKINEIKIIEIEKIQKRIHLYQSKCKQQKKECKEILAIANKQIEILQNNQALYNKKIDRLGLSRIPIQDARAKLEKQIRSHFKNAEGT